MITDILTACLHGLLLKKELLMLKPFKFFLFTFVLITSLTSVKTFAQNFPARAQVFVTPARVYVDIYNPYYEPISCSGQVFGQTMHGQLITSYFFHPRIPAGGVIHHFVYSNVMSPFVTGWSNVFCHFLRF